MKTPGSFSALIAAGCLVLIIGGCTKDPAVAKQKHLEKAKAHYAKNQYNEAIIEVKNALRLDPKFAPALHLIGRAYAGKAWHLDAVRELRRANELDPNNLDAHIDLGRAYSKVEGWEDVLREAVIVAEKDPANVSAMYLRAAALNAKGQREDALTSIDKALAAGQSPPEFHTVRGDILTGLDRFGEAEQAYRAALAQNPKYAAATLGLGDVLRRQNRPDEARRLLDQAKADDPTNASVRLALSEMYSASGKFDEALKEVNALPRQSWTPRVAFVAGTLSVRTGNFPDAVTILKSVKQMIPAHPAPRYWLGYALLGVKRPVEAVVEFQAAVEKDPNNGLMHFGLATALVEAGRSREALAELNKLAKPLEKMPQYHLLVGRTQLSLGATDDAIKAGRTAVALAPQNAAAYTLIGTAYAAKGDVRAAHEAFAKAVEVDPTFTPGRVALGHIYNAEKKPEDAIKEYDAAIVQDPRSRTAAEAKVATLIRQNRLDDAIVFAQTTAKSDAKSPAAHELLGRLYAQKKDMKSAEREFNEALRLEDGFVPARLGMAQLAVANGKADDAIPHLQRVLKDQPSHVGAALMLADLHLRKFRYDQAIAVVESAEKDAPDRTASSLMLAHIYMGAGRFDQAIARLAPVVKENPNAIQARLITGIAQYRKRDVADAISQFEAVNRLNPNLPESHYYLGRALLARGDVEGAKKELQRAAELAPDKKRINVELALASGKTLDPQLLSSWVEELKAVVAKDPTNTASREELAGAYLSRKQWAEAEAELKRVLEASPLSPGANRGMALVRLGQKKPDEALPYLLAVVKVEPANPQANLLLASYYETKGNREQAVPYAEALLRANPDNADIKLRLANLYGLTGRVAQGIARAKEVVASAPKSAEAHLLLGGLYVRNGELAPAIDALTTATRLAPNSDAAHFTLGSAYERKGDTAAAITAYKRAIELNPKHAPAYNNAAYLYAAQAKNLDEALALAQKARDLQPNAGPVIDTLGFVHYQRGEYQQAEPLLKKASELAPKNATIFYHLGTTYYKLGRRDDATTALRRSLQIDDKIPQAAEIQMLLTELKK